MTISRRQYQAYSVAMQTMAGSRQVVMLYEGIIRYLLQAREAVTQRRVQARYNNLVRASEIIFGLQGCLDFERGGEVARTLYNFYVSIDGRIFSLHFNNDLAMYDDLVNDVRRMRDVWVEIDAATGGDAAGSPPPSPKPDSGDGVAVSA